MTDPSSASALDAAVRAVRGESDLDAVCGTHHLVHAVAARCGGLPSLLDATTIADPALSDVMERLIGTPAGQESLRAWAEVAPAGRGRPHVAALIAAVQRRRCDPASPPRPSVQVMSPPLCCPIRTMRRSPSVTGDSPHPQPRPRGRARCPIRSEHG